MSITSVSVGHSGWAHYGHAAASRGKHADGDAQSGDASARAGVPARSDRLVSAMMQALQGLAPAASTVAAPTAPTAVSAAEPGAPAEAAATPTVAGPGPAAGSDLNQAAMAFAHELYAALRSDSDGHPGRHLGWTRGYGNLSHRLNALAQTIEANAASMSATGSTTTKGATSTTNTSAAIGDTSASPTPTLGVTPQSTMPVTSATAPLADGLATAATATTAPAPAPSASSAAPPARIESPLLDAFERLSSAMAPTASGSTSASSSTAEKLADFLRTLAGTLLLGRDAASELPAQGSLLDVHG